MTQRTRSHSSAWVIWYCVALHAWWGVILLYDPAASGVTAIAEMTRLTRTTTAAGIVYLGVSAMATIGLLRVRPGSTAGLLELLPQQGALLISAFGACQATIASRFADGVVRSWAFIAADQAPAVLIAIAHTAALIGVFAAGRSQP